MNVKRFIYSSLTVFVFIFSFELLLHNVLLKEWYLNTASLWRSPEEMSGFALFLLAGQLLYSFVFSFVFIKGYENKGLMEGVRYGIWMGLLVLSNLLVGFAVSPYPADLVCVWTLGAFVELIIAGGIIALLYRK